MALATAGSMATSVWSHMKTTPGNVCNTRTGAPGVTPRAVSRSARAGLSRSTRTTEPRSPADSEDNRLVGLEGDMQHLEDRIQPGPGSNGNHGDDGQNRKCRASALFFDHHEEVRDTRDEQRHHGQGHDR